MPPEIHIDRPSVLGESPLEGLMRRLPEQAEAHRRAHEAAHAEAEALRKEAEGDAQFADVIRQRIKQGPAAERALLEGGRAMVIPPEIIESVGGAVGARQSADQGVAFAGEGVRTIGGKVEGPTILPGTAPSINWGETAPPRTIKDAAPPQPTDVAPESNAGVFRLGDLYQDAERQGREALAGLDPEEIDDLFRSAQSGAPKKIPGHRDSPTLS